MSATDNESAVKDALARAGAHAPYLALQLRRHDRVRAALDMGDVEAALAAARTEGAETGEVMAALRRERGGLALALAIGDLAGLLPLERVVAELSGLADRALAAALTAAIAERTPDAAPDGFAPEGFAIVALGKLGSRELNFSSDVDLLYLYDPARLPLRPREEPGQAAVRIGQRVNEIMQRRTEDGHVFRVDLRLRPSSEVTPIALPVDAAISYYESSALAWERAAFIRARAVAGDAAIGRYFLESLHPFVWRRSLDFGTVAEVRAISGRIRDHYARGQLLGPGFDLKRGRGGIREIEFFAQIHQLIHGGRNPDLRAPATLAALEALAEDGRIGADEAAALGGAYRLLRTVEHRLQMVEDRQTHALPADLAALDGVARLHGLCEGGALVDLLRRPTGEVARIYAALGGEEGGEDRLPVGPEALEARLAGAGFPEPAAARARIEGWRSARARSLRTAAAREAFEAMLPTLIQAFGAAPDPMRAMNRFDDVVARLPSGINFYRLLEARPGLTALLGTLLSHAPALAEQLGRRPELLDGLIDASAFEPARDVDALAADFATAERAGEDYQLFLDRIRRRVNEARFALGAQIVLARSDPLEAAGGYARVAEAAIRVLADAAIAEFASRHGHVEGSELVILGLGRLGGGALTHASDLDLIYLFTGSHEGESDGPKRLRATDYFNRLALRVSAALSVPTAAGPLYDVDTRLRPSGKDGLVAVSLASFADYQRERAWTLEHMALTRARPVYGSAPARAAVAEAVRAVLELPRDPDRLRAEAVRLRADTARHKPPYGTFDIKLGKGGLVDLEYAVHLIQLGARIGLDPSLDAAIDALVAHGRLPPAIADAHRLLTRMLITFRLVAPDSEAPPDASRPLVAKACGMANWEEMVAAHEAARELIRASWLDIAGVKEER